jgi:3-oxoacyl-[acyl-carrier protein] reductase
MASNTCPRQVAIVTGALRGIGRACTLGLAQSGFNVLVNDRNHEGNEPAIEGLMGEIANHGGEGLFVSADVGDLRSHSMILGAASERWGRIDCLVNNAGVSSRQRGDLLQVESDSFDECFYINTRAVFFLSQAVARYMLEQEPLSGHRSIVNITSSNAVAVSISRGEYCVSKAASSMTTKLFALRLAATGIGVYEVRPGIIETDMTRPAKVKYDQLIGEHLVPADRWGFPIDVASTVRCMAEGRLVYTVGQAITVDGGLIMPRF